MAPAVKVRLEVEGAPEAVAALRQFTQQSKSAGKQVETGFGAAGGALTKLTGALKGVGYAFVALKLVQLASEAKDFTLETVRLAAEMKDLALQTGTTVRNMSALSAVAKVTNTDQGKLTKGLGDLADRIKDLRQGVPAAVKGFGQLGLSAKDFSSDDVVVNAAKVAEALEKVARGGTKGALAVDAIGKSGRALLPVFEKLNELGGLEGATAFAEKMGVLVDSKTIATFEAIATELELMEMSARGLALRFAEALGPDLLVVLREIQNLFFDAKPAAEVFGRAIGALVRVVGMLVINLAALGTVLARIATLQWGKIAGDVEKYDQALQRLATDYPKIAAFDDSVGGAVGDAAVRAYEEHLRKQAQLDEEYARAQARKLQAYEERQEVELEEQRRKGLIGLDAYYKARERIAIAALQRELDRLDALSDSLPKGSREQDISRAQATAIREQIGAIILRNESELESARASAKSFAGELRGSLSDALTQFATHGIQQVKSLADAFRQLGIAIASAVARVAGTYLVQSLPFLQPAAGKAAGGLLAGPGTGTSDSIPIWASSGEYVVRAGAVARPGVLSLLEAINSEDASVMPAVRRALAFELRPSRYAEGGMVDAQVSPMVTNAGAAATIGGQVTVGLEEGLILKALESPEGQRRLLRIVAKNPRAFNAAMRRP